MSYTPTTAAQNTAALAGTNQAGLAAPLTALQNSIAAGNLAPAALMDAILSSVGYQGRATVAAIAATTVASTFTDYGTAYTFVAPIAKTYLVHVQASVTSSNGGGTCYFRLNNTTTGNLFDESNYVSTNANFNGTHQSVSFVVAVPMNAGNNVLKLQAVDFAYVGTIHFSSDGVNDTRKINVWG